MNILISRRNNPDWLNVKTKIWPRFAEYEDFWNRHYFNLTYREYRHELQQIANDNLLDVENATIGDPVEGEWCLPIDDDDWLSPNIINELTNSIHNNDKYYWNSTEMYKGQISDGINHWVLYCKTNNYCFIYDKEINSVFKNHGAADKEFSSSLNKPAYINKKLSFINRSVGSASCFLGKELESIDIEKDIEDTLHFLKEDVVILNPHILWVKPYVDNYRRLIESL